MLQKLLTNMVGVVFQEHEGAQTVVAKDQIYHTNPTTQNLK